jgi:hypothetical protein
MEYIIINGVAYEIPLDVVVQGRAAVQAFCDKLVADAAPAAAPPARGRKSVVSDEPSSE